MNFNRYDTIIIGDTMMNLGDYFSYNSDDSDISFIFEKIFRQLEDIHNKGMVVSFLTSKSILYDDDFRFSDIIEPYDFELQKRENIKSLAKLMLGTYLSCGTGFKDFSVVNDDWFLSNIGNIINSITADGFYSEYFEELFTKSNYEYYSDFIDRKKQDNALNNKGNVNSFKKVLKTAASSLYSDDNDYQSESDYQKTASINSLFYPLLIGSSLLITLLILLFIKINH